MGRDLDKEDLPFEVPEFNEDEFVRKELISFRTTVLLFVYSLLVALATYFLWRSADLPFVAVLLIALAAGGALPFLYRLFRVDISHFRRKEWIGTVLLHFFFWLGFTLLLSNPPFSDNATPVIEAYAAPSVQGVGEEVRFVAYIGDNRGLDEQSISACLRSDAPGATCVAVPWRRVEGEPIWTYTWRPAEAGNYTLEITATDTGGLGAFAAAPVKVGDPFPVIDPSEGSTFDSLSDSLVVRPAQGFRALRSVQYDIDGRAYNMSRPTEDRPTYWTTNPTFPGWKAGPNNVTIIALEQPEYLHGYKLEGGVSRSTGATRTYTVSATYPDLATAKGPEHEERRAPNIGQSPGAGAAAGLLGVALLALALRRTRRDD